MEIRVLKRRGLGIRAIARELGCSRTTVKRYLRDRTASRYGPRQPRPTKLDPHKAYLLERIAAARPRWIPAVVLLREIREHGYSGGITQLKAFINPLKQVKADPVVRFETAPGEQMQADFTVIRRGREPLLAFVATWATAARAGCASPPARTRRHYAPACGRHCSTSAGCQHVLFDNAKTIIIERDAYGEGKHRWHSGLLALSEEYGFGLKVCRPYRAKTKGKVERFNGYLKGSFLVPLAATLRSAGLKLDVAAANAHVGRWLSEVGNARVHATTEERPDRRLTLERSALLPLPSRSRQTILAPESTRPLPIESLQHPLAVYDALLEVAP